MTDFEIQPVEGIREYFENGLSQNQLYNNKPLISMVNQFLSGNPEFKECIKAFMDYCLEIDDKTMLAGRTGN